MLLLIKPTISVVPMTICGFDKNGDEKRGMSEMTREDAC